MNPQQSSILSGIKQRIETFLEQQQYTNAIFLADKLYHFTFQNKKDWSVDQQEAYSLAELESIYLLAKAYFGSGQYKRALNLLTSSFINFAHRAPMDCFYLAAKCLEKCDDWLEILSLFGENDTDFEQVLQRQGSKEVGFISN